ncbi:MAG: hypothetical protein H6735_09960 [Alphaproteobacteria bacterium]|nr:hypothetical protein [Alphaproteobacteria bacterium]
MSAGQTVEVRCRSCHRLERRDGSRVEVVAEGGGRAPSEPAPRATWRVMRAASEGELLVVGSCPCGQPLVAPPGAGLPSLPLSLQLPEGELTLRDGDLALGGSPVSPDDAQRKVEAAFPPPPPDRLADAFAGSLMVLILVPTLFWVSVVGFVVIFLTGLGSAPFSEPP